MIVRRRVVVGERDGERLCAAVRGMLVAPVGCLNVILLCGWFRAARTGFCAKREEKVIRCSVFLNHDDDMLKARQTCLSARDSEPKKSRCECDVGLHVVPPRHSYF